MSSSLCSNKGHRSLYCGSASILVLAAFLLSFVLVGCSREDKLSPNSDNSISISVSTSSVKKSLSKGVVSSTKNSLSSESSSNALASDEFYFGEIAYEQNGSSVSDDLGNFSITIEPNDGHFRYSSNPNATAVTESNSNVNEISSKTAYSGQYYTEGGKKYERIDWVVGDKLSLWSDKGRVVSYLSNNGNDWATYEVMSVTTNALNSNAMIVADNNGNGLWWDANGGEHTFIGFYPAISGGVQSSSDAYYYTYELPTSQIAKQNSTDANLYEADLSQYGFMSAYKKANPTSNLPIEFLPGFSAIEFNIKGAQDVNMILKSVEVVSTDNYLSTKSGESNYRVGYKKDGSSNLLEFESAATKSEKRVVLTFKDKNGAAISPALDNSTPTKFTIILSGAEDITDLTITLNMDFEKNGTTTSGKRTLLLKDKTSGTPITIPACSKVVIGNMMVPGDETFIITQPDDIIYYGHEAGSISDIYIESYRVASGSKSEISDIQFRYYEDASNSITDPKTEIASADWGSTTPLWFNNGNGLVETSSLTYVANYGAQPNSTTIVEDEAAKINAALRSAIPLGTKINPIDLSMHTIQGVARSASEPVCANSYVIRGPGWYMFPLIYGNAIDYGSHGLNHSTNIMATTALGGNRQAYSPTTVSPSDTYLSPFKGYYDHDITKPSIIHDIANSSIITADQKAKCTIENLNACIVWEDNDGSKPLVDVSSVEVVEQGNTGSKVRTNSGLTGVPYIRFYVNAGENIKQGNVLIALRNADNTILWSWHIWVTSLDLSPITITDWTNSKYKVMPYTLGFCDNRVKTIQTWNDYGTVWVKVFQTGRENMTAKYFRVIHKGDSEGTASTIGTSCLYQWGRKDPFISGDGNPDILKNKECYSPSGYILTISSTELNFADVTQTGSIQPRYSIRRPWQMQFRIDTPSYWMAGASSHINLWNSVTTISNSALNYAVRKTIYDPCPPGFSVMQKNTLSIASKTGTNTYDRAEFNTVGEFNYGMEIFTDKTRSNTLFLPNSFARIPSTRGALSYFAVHVWSAAPIKLSTAWNASNFGANSGMILPQQNMTLAHGMPVLPQVN